MNDLVNRDNPSPSPAESTSKGIQSVEVGVGLLRALAQSQSALSLSALASAAQMAPAKAHKYLASYLRSGLISQDRAGGHYDLGPFALELGFAAMRRLDVVELSRPTLENLRDQLSTSAALAVWANQGPTIIRSAEPLNLMTSHIRIGTVMPILTSSFGRCFAAYLDRRITQDMMRAELAQPDGLAARSGIQTIEQVESMLAEIRTHGVSSATTLVDPGRVALSAPVFNHDGQMVAAVVTVGAAGQFDTTWSGSPAKTLTAATRALSRQLGYQG